MPLEEAWLREMYLKQRKTLREIATLSGYSVGTVRYWLTFYGITRDSEGWSRRPAAHTLAQLRDEQGWSASQIANHYGVTLRAVQKWFTAYGMEPPHTHRRQQRARDTTPGQRQRRFTIALPTTYITREPAPTDDETLTFDGHRVRVLRQAKGWYVRVLRQTLGPHSTRRAALTEAARHLWDHGHHAAAETLIERAARDQRRGSR